MHPFSDPDRAGRRPLQAAADTVAEAVWPYRLAARAAWSCAPAGLATAGPEVIG